MKVSKAIEILTTFDKGQYPGGAENFRAALQLGLEALKRTFRHRENTPSNIYIPLPGETSEEEVKR